MTISHRASPVVRDGGGPRDHHQSRDRYSADDRSADDRIADDYSAGDYSVDDRIACITFPVVAVRVLTETTIAISVVPREGEAVAHPRGCLPARKRTT